MDPERAMGRMDRRATLLTAAFVLTILTLLLWSQHRAGVAGRTHVIAVLQAKGFANVEVRRAFWTPDCFRSQIGYRWTATGAQGRACTQAMAPDDVTLYEHRPG